MGDKKYKGRLPDDVAKMEKDIDGVGRYTAGAICSMAYGIRTPIVSTCFHLVWSKLIGIDRWEYTSTVHSIIRYPC